ncbi:MAG: glycosyltransferase family 2 protein [Bacteroidaceae bacterium]|nr:glycosyltransferase family 2 protein [Prevotellaceae bacterium]MDY5761451.1 glycosyltransferase family 2 protein [Bacteroidaceae bacterium]
MPNTTPLVSIVMPAFNAEKTIVRAIDSVLKQTYSNIELLIINDGSTDNTSEIVSKYRDSRVTLINQGNKGLSGARNTGLENIKGEYVTFLDSDDWCEADFVERLISSMTVNKAQLSVCGMIAHKNAGVSYSASFESTYNSSFENAEFLSKFESGIMNSVCNKLYQTSIIHGESLKFKKIAIVEDLDFNLRYFDCIKRVCFVPNYLYHYDNNHSVLTTKVSSDMFDNYIHIHALLLSKVPITYFPIISSFVYHQYVALCLRYVNLFIGKKMSSKEIRSVLDIYLSNTLVHYSLRTYHSKCLGEWVLTVFLRYKQIGLLSLYTHILNNRKSIR